MTRAEGFTLIELLIVLVVVGILASLGFSNFLNAQRGAQLREASAQFTADLQRARSAAQRYNQDAGLVLDKDKGASSYTLTIDGNATVRQLPHGAEVSMVGNNGNGVTYNAPYGEVNVGDTSFTLSSERTQEVRTVRVIGVTGKVISQ